ncbi:MAG TPA: DUF2007 domain-containing protein [Marinobacter sp.]|nr:DUF2007 domain-containing protein [Marinobacter sp.]
MQIAYRARDITEAHIVAGLLRANGITAYVGGHYLQGAMGEIGAADFSNIHVSDEDLYRSRELVREYEARGQTEVSSSTEFSNSNEDKPTSYARGFLMALAILVVVILYLKR